MEEPSSSPATSQKVTPARCNQRRRALRATFGECRECGQPAQGDYRCEACKAKVRERQKILMRERRRKAEEQRKQAAIDRLNAV